MKGARFALAALGALTVLGFSVFRWWNRDPRRIAQRGLQSVVVIEAKSAAGATRELGTGFFVEPGVIVTNLHVVEGSSKAMASTVSPMSEYVVEGVIAADRLNDLVLLKVTPESGRPVSLGRDEALAVGETVYVVGNPQGLAGSFSQGVVSAVRLEGRRAVIQMTAPISAGSSGSPVLDGGGSVVGVAFATVRAGQNLNLASPVSAVMALGSVKHAAEPLETLISSNGSDRARCGLRGLVAVLTVLPQAGAILRSPAVRCQKEGDANADGLRRHPGILAALHKRSGVAPPKLTAITERFDRQGRLQEIIDHGELAELGHTAFTFSPDGHRLSTRPSGNCDYSHGQGITTETCDGSGAPKTNKELTYDSAGRLVQTRIVYYAANGTPFSDTFVRFEYDARGCRRSERSWRGLGILGEPPGELGAVAITCDEFQNPIETKTEFGLEHANRCSYEYDPHGNWTTRKCWMANSPDAVETVQRRITYFE